MKNNIIFIGSLVTLLMLLSPVLTSSEPDDLKGQDTINLLQSSRTFATVITPSTEVYDDGTFRKTFSGYRIYDMENNLLASISPSLDFPVRLRLEEGQYIIKPDFNERKVYRISVTLNSVNEFVIKNQEAWF